MNIKIIKPISIAFLAFLVSLSITTPKGALFYTIERVFSDKKIELGADKTTNFFLFLKLDDLKLNSSTNKILKSKNSYFFTSYIYSGCYISSPKLSDAINSMLPIKLDSIYASNSVFAPTIINIRVSGSFGHIAANIDAKDGKIKAKLEFDKAFEAEATNASVKNALMSKFKQTEEGLVYESNI